MQRQLLILTLGGLLWITLCAVSCNREEQKPITTDYLQGHWWGSQLLLADRGLDGDIQTELYICQDSFYLVQQNVPKTMLWEDSCWTAERISVHTLGAYKRGAFELTFSGRYLNPCNSWPDDPFQLTFDAQRKDAGLRLWNDETGIYAQLSQREDSDPCTRFGFD